MDKAGELLPLDVFDFAKTQQPLGDAVFVVRRDHSIAQWCSGCSSLWGYSEEQALSLTVEDLMPSSFRAHHYRLFERYWADEEVARRMASGNEIKGESQDGSLFPLEVYLFRIRDYVVVVARVEIIELSERLQAVTEVAQHAKRWALGIAALSTTLMPVAVGFAPVLRGLTCKPKMETTNERTDGYSANREARRPGR